MTEFNEPVWVGMDVDAELARYEREDRRRVEEKRVLAALASSPRGKGRCAPMALVGKEASASRSPLAA
ncbi:MAG TPA: hypothetical protein VII45_01920 [Solirubrobacterales bacterium]